MELDFVHHLIGQQYFDDAIVVLNQLSQHDAVAQEIWDTIYHLKGHCFFELQQYDSATFFFNLLGEDFYAFRPALCFKACYANCQTKNFDTATKLLKSKTPEKSDSLYAIYRVFKLGVELLKRNDTVQFAPDSTSMLAHEELALWSVRDKIREHKSKSYWLAGILSALLPGTGKIYAGNKGGGAVALFSNLLLGLVAAENVIKAGFLAARTWIFGGIFLLFYMGNMYGSVYNVQAQNIDFANETDSAILHELDMAMRIIL